VDHGGYITQFGLIGDHFKRHLLAERDEEVARRRDILEHTFEYMRLANLSAQEIEDLTGLDNSEDEYWDDNDEVQEDSNLDEEPDVEDESNSELDSDFESVTESELQNLGARRRKHHHKRRHHRSPSRRHRKRRRRIATIDQAGHGCKLLVIIIWYTTHTKKRCEM